MWGHYQQKNVPPNHGFRENAQNDELYCDLRYQGQIEDRESGLYYNVNRYYDADSGQYLSPDPIGFGGGLRPQAYVFNPLEWVDPLGLAGCPKDHTSNPKKKVNLADVKDIVRTPDTHLEDFHKSKGLYKNKYTQEIWQKSHTDHSDKLGEWKVGLGKNKPPMKTKKVTVGRSDGKILKIDGK